MSFLNRLSNLSTSTSSLVLRRALRNKNPLASTTGRNMSTKQYPALYTLTDQARIPTKAEHSTHTNMNLSNAINDALDLTLERDESAVIFGEDVGFGGIFCCTKGLQSKHGADRVFSTPASENGILGLGIGYSTTGKTSIAEIQFADYILPAFDQIINEAAKLRYRSGNEFSCGKITIRAPCGLVGVGGLYHSGSNEALFSHTAGLKIVIPRGPYQAKGLLLSCIEDDNPCLFLEPKALYNKGKYPVPNDYYKLPLSQADLVQEGDDLTIIAWGNQTHVSLDAIGLINQKINKTCDLIDLQTILPWDEETVYQSIEKTGRVIITHEAAKTSGFGAELAASIQEACHSHLKAPVKRVAAFDTPVPRSFETFYAPTKWKILQAAEELCT